MDHHHLAIDDGLPRDIERANNGQEPLHPVQAVACECLVAVAVEVELDAVAVVLISWSHWSPDGALPFRVASWGLMNPGIEGHFIRNSHKAHRGSRPTAGSLPMMCYEV